MLYNHEIKTQVIIKKCYFILILFIEFIAAHFYYIPAAFVNLNVFILKSVFVFSILTPWEHFGNMCSHFNILFLGMVFY